MWTKALRQTGNGLIIRVEVSPASSADSWAGYDQWREAIKVKLKAEARRGQANDALTEFIADALGVPSSSVRILTGARSRIKEVAVASIEMRTATARLAGVLAR